MSIQERIQSDLTSAMKARETLKLGVLRMMKTAVKNKEIEKREALDVGEVLAVLNTLVKQRRDSAVQFRNGGRSALAEKEESEIRVIEAYLPAPATDVEIQAAIAGAISETGAEGPRDMGKVMKAAMALLSGKTVDGGKVSGLVRAKLR